MKCYEFIIKGRVQGVGYRYFVLKAALKYNLKGYVKNLYNGDVQCVVLGDDNDIENFEKQLQIGPSLARVRSVKKSYIENCNDYNDFSIKY